MLVRRLLKEPRRGNGRSLIKDVSPRKDRAQGDWPGPGD